MSFNETIGVISNYVGLATAVPIFWTWYEISLGSKKSERNFLKRTANEVGNRPGILVVDLLPSRNIEQAVDRFRQSNEQLKAIPKELVFKIDYSRPMSAESMPDLANDLRKMAGVALNHGVDVLHVFYAGPAIAAALVGAEFSNTFRVILYHHNTNDSANAYENWGLLKYHLIQ